MSFQHSRSRQKLVRLPRILSTRLLPLTFSIIAGHVIADPVIYGKINVSLDQFDHQGAANIIGGSSPSIADQWELNSNASRLGVKGELPLENSGLKVIYLAEFETNADDGGSDPFSQRNIYIGVQGQYGQVIGGKFDTPLKVIEGKVDQFNDLKADIDVLVGGQNRVNNIVQYSTPKLGNLFTASLAFVTAEGADVDLDGEPDDGLTDTLSASLVADNGIFYGAIAYDTNQLARRSIDGLVRADILRAVATAKLGQFEIGALLQKAKDVADSDGEDISYLISGGWTLGNIKLKAQAGLTKGDISNEEGRLAALGLDYSLGKKTIVYTYFSSLKVDERDLSDDTFSVGLSHSF